MVDDSSDHACNSANALLSMYMVHVAGAGAVGHVHIYGRNAQAPQGPDHSDPRHKRSPSLAL